MSVTVYVALYGWIPVTIFMFAVLPARRAAFGSLILGYLFLPQAALQHGGFIDVTKPVVIGLALFFGVLLVDPKRISSMRFRWFDLLMVVWLFVPMASSITNGLGAYDGLSGMIAAFIEFVVPYSIGRLYVRNMADARALALALFIGGLVYVPFVLYEARMSPTLHHHVYGYTQHVFGQSRRLGGWRPMVFLQHGLALGIWMSTAALAGLWLWQAKRLSRIWVLEPLVSVPLVFITAVLSRSLGAILIMLMALAALYVCKLFRTLAPLYLFVFLVPGYLTARVALDWEAEVMVEAVKALDYERGLSLEGRIAADQRIRDRAMLRPAFGWGGYNRFREGLGPTLPDSYWVIVLGKKGWFGLGSLFGVLVLAPLLALRRLRRAGGTVMTHPALVVLVTVLGVFTLDCMVNAMVSSVFLAVAGALIGLDPRIPGPARVTRARQQAAQRPGSKIRLDRPRPAPEVRR